MCTSRMQKYEVFQNTSHKFCTLKKKKYQGWWFRGACHKKSQQSHDKNQNKNEWHRDKQR